MDLTDREIGQFRKRPAAVIATKSGHFVLSAVDVIEIFSMCAVYTL